MRHPAHSRDGEHVRPDGARRRHFGSTGSGATRLGTQRQDNARSYHLQRHALPSDAFRAHVFSSFQDDDLGVRERATIGLEGIMLGSDYPHSESTFPRSMAIMSERLRDVPEDDAR